MKLLLSFLFSIGLLAQVSGQGIDFFHGTLAEAMEKAKLEDKVIFVDAYASWCGPCKRMAKTTFKDEKVGEYFNKTFINMKIDCEKGEGPAFRSKYPVSAFPTLYFIAPDGETIHRQKGAQKVDQIIELAKFALSKYDKSGDYATEYEKGSRDPELVYNYVKALNAVGKPSLKIANDFIKDQKDLTSDQNLKFIHEAAVEADSKIFDLLVVHKSKILTLVGEEAFFNKITSACQKTATKAIEFESPDLHKEAKEKMKKHNSKGAASFAVENDMAFYKAMNDSKNYLKVVNTYAKKEVKNDANRLNKLAEELVVNFPENNSALKAAEKFAQKASSNGGLYNYYFTYASILHKNGKKKQALENAEKSLELAKGVPGVDKQIKMLIDTIKSNS